MALSNPHHRWGATAFAGRRAFLPVLSPGASCPPNSRENRCVNRPPRQIWECGERRGNKDIPYSAKLLLQLILQSVTWSREPCAPTRVHPLAADAPDAPPRAGTPHAEPCRFHGAECPLPKLQGSPPNLQMCLTCALCAPSLGGGRMALGGGDGAHLMYGEGPQVQRRTQTTCILISESGCPTT